MVYKSIKSGKKLLFPIICFLAALLISARVGASVPDELFSMDKEVFWKKIDDGHFADLLELHLVQYAADPKWKFDWAQSRYDGSGAIMEHGSTSGRRLYIDREIALNVRLSESFSTRYDMRERRDGRFDFFDQRLDGLWNFTKNNAVILSGWPTNEKKDSSIGLGWLWKGGKGEYFSLIIMDERPFFNRKTSDSFKFEKPPIRWLADGSMSKKRARGYFSLSLGQPYRIIKNSEVFDEGAAEADGAASNGSAALEFGSFKTWSIGAACRFSMDKFKWLGATADNDPFSLRRNRKWAHVEGYVKKKNKDLIYKGLFGYAFQNDAFSDAMLGEGFYAMDTWLFGLEASYEGWMPVKLNFGYFGSFFQMDRESNAFSGYDLPLSDRSEKGYADKLQGALLYRFNSRSAMEFLLSKEVYRQRFGGASVKAVLIF